jgi:Na+-transporting NADH:ubiquinone oxidoreductase subunit C
MHSNAYTFRFAAMLTIVFSVLLAGAATLLKPRQLENEKLDKKKNILVSVGVKPANGESYTRKEIQDQYAAKIREYVIDASGEIVEGKKPADIDSKNKNGMLPLFTSVESGKVVSYVLPVSGKGLWSTIYGYLALESDLNTVNGVTFYKHGETPGLGGEIEKDWFTGNFKGKKIKNNAGELVSIDVLKGKVIAGNPNEIHQVDGISGATLTARGVAIFIKSDLEKYKPFFAKEEAKEGGE